GRKRDARRPHRLHFAAMKLALAALLVLSCHGSHDGGADQKQEEAPGKTGTASISGTITFQGTVPEMHSITPTADCAKLKGPSPAVLAVKDGGVKDAFVWIKEGISGKYPMPPEPITLDQKGCEYTPRVLGARSGQTLILANSDPLLHNVHAPNFNVPL